MGRLFEDRERAAEGLFAHDEEARFVAHRRGIVALAAWAGESMALDEISRATYAERLLDLYVTGAHDNEIVTAVQTDLERAGKPTLTSQVGLVLSQAIAEATAAAHPHPSGPEHGKKDPFEQRSLPPKKPTLGWSL